MWHGSRLTNFVGILTHGLKIAPPEAPATGYMFGKGIYFADMVSKSANYCCTNPSNSTGLMLLCEVALGDMVEYENAHYVTKLPKNKHSVKGIGRTEPDPKESYIREDGVEIPLGKGKVLDSKPSSLLYNEYIVYDVAQVNCQYLFKINFKYKYKTAFCDILYDILLTVQVIIIKQYFFSFSTGSIWLTISLCSFKYYICLNILFFFVLTVLGPGSIYLAIFYYFLL